MCLQFCITTSVRSYVNDHKRTNVPIFRVTQKYTENHSQKPVTTLHHRLISVFFFLAIAQPFILSYVCCPCSRYFYFYHWVINLSFLAPRLPAPTPAYDCHCKRFSYRSDTDNSNTDDSKFFYESTYDIIKYQRIEQ